MSGNIVTIDIGEHFFKIADIEPSKKTLRANAISFTEVPFNLYSVTSEDNAKQAADTIRRMITDANVRKSEVNIIIPDSQSYTRVFDMPYLTDKELVSAIKYQADQFIPIPIDQVSLDIHVVMKDKALNKTTILLVAAPNTVISHVIKIVEDSALIPVNIENEMSASLKAISFMVDSIKKDKNTQFGTYIFVNFGNSSTSLFLYDMDANLPLQVHNFSIGRQIFVKDLQANYMINDEQVNDLLERIGFSETKSDYNVKDVISAPMKEFESELQRFIVSSKEKNPTDVKGIYIFGEGIRFAGFVEMVNKSLGLPIQELDMNTLFEKNTVSEYFSKDMSLLIPAIGGNLLK